MANYQVSAGTFYDRVVEIVKENMDENVDAMRKQVLQAARKSRNELKGYKGTHIHGVLREVGWSTGRYATGWKVYYHKGELAYGHFEAVVANASVPQLTHLIENGHVKYIFGRGPYGFVRAHKHIEPAYEAGAKKMKGATVDNP